MSDTVSRRRFLGTAPRPAPAPRRPPAVAARAVHPAGRARERVEKIATICEMCFWRCGVLATSRDGRVVRVEGNPDHPLTQGRLCARGNAGTGLLYDPDRLKNPLLRTGERGEGAFERGHAGTRRSTFSPSGSKLRESTARRRVAFFPHGIGARFFDTLHARPTAPRTAPSRPSRSAAARARSATRSPSGTALGSPEPVDLEEARARRPDRQPPRRERASPPRSRQFADGPRARREADRGRPALLDRRRRRPTGGCRSGRAPTSRSSSPG